MNSLTHRLLSANRKCREWDQTTDIDWTISFTFHCWHRNIAHLATKQFTIFIGNFHFAVFVHQQRADRSWNRKFHANVLIDDKNMRSMTWMSSSEDDDDDVRNINRLSRDIHSSHVWNETTIAAAMRMSTIRMHTRWRTTNSSRFIFIVATGQACDNLCIIISLKHTRRGFQLNIRVWTAGVRRTRSFASEKCGTKWKKKKKKQQWRC